LEIYKVDYRLASLPIILEAGQHLGMELVKSAEAHLPISHGPRLLLPASFQAAFQARPAGPAGLLIGHGFFTEF